MENEKIEAGSMEPGAEGSKKWLPWLVGLIILGGVGYGGYYLGNNQNARNNNQTNLNNQSPNIQTPTTTQPTTPSSKNQEPRQSGGQASTKNETNPTVDWKTYENKDYGFSFKYPKDLTIDEIPISAAINQTRGDGPLLDVLLNAKDLQGAVLSVSVLNKSIDDAIKYDKSTYGVKTTEKGKVGTKLTGGFYGMEYAINGNYTYFFRQVNSRNTGDKTIFDQILSTFKFTK